MPSMFYSRTSPLTLQYRPIGFVVTGDSGGEF